MTGRPAEDHLLDALDDAGREPFRHPLHQEAGPGRVQDGQVLARTTRSAGSVTDLWGAPSMMSSADFSHFAVEPVS